MSSTPTIVIVTPTIAGRASLLRECKFSVRKACECFERGFVMHEILQDTAFIGPGAMRNLIAEKWKGMCEWFLFLDDDNVLLPEYFRELFPYTENLDVVYSNAETRGDDVTYRFHHFDPLMLLGRNIIDTCALVRADMFWEVGGFPTSLVGTEKWGTEEWYLWKKILVSGGRFRGINKKLWRYHSEGWQTITNIRKEASDPSELRWKEKDD